ncbi:hypothetical protein [Streptomyces lavendulae]|uniref:hypothetical protein n=1 Tax=Streptomyces lavendulae TaxID=1914 RepID=UPI0024A0F63E|nr:hypothetical protein [Streptomyces lavendulae]GLW01554.1 hypothetical protein Slala05_51850 [Streptomyces lavendulae subsp. lavendulae]
MPNNHEIPTGRNGRDDEQWNDFVRRFEEDRADGTEGSTPPPAPGPRRAWPRNLALALLAAGATFVVLKFTGSSPYEGTAAPDRTASARSGAAPAVPSAAPARGTQAAVLDTRPMAPLDELFPAEVKGASGAAFTRLGSKALESCTEPDSVGPRLAALIEDGAGCVGEQIAFYKDDRNNQFNMAVFTMKDQRDSLRVATELAMAFDDYQVAVQAPPAGSGLPALPADSGLVQAFTGHGRVMVVALGQWSDGRTADFQRLTDGMAPLRDEVSRRVAAHEGTG